MMTKPANNIKRKGKYYIYHFNVKIISTYQYLIFIEKIMISCFEGLQAFDSKNTNQ